MLLTFGIVGVLATAILEVGMRAFVRVTDMYFYFYDPLLGPRTGPNQVGRYIRGKWVDAPFRFNNQGWNHRDDYAIAKPAGALRVCMLGDSQVESLQVDLDQAMYAVAERAMSRPERPVQWYSFGTSGWGTNVEHEAMRHYALDYRPDLVILLFVQNDPFDASPYLVDVPTFRPTYVLDANGAPSLVLPTPSWQPSQRPRLGSRSALYRYFMAQQRLYDRWMGRRNLRPGVGGLPLLEIGEGANGSFVPGLEAMPMAEREARTWRLIEALLGSMRDEAQRRGAVFAVAFRGWTAEIEAPRTGEPFVAPPRERDVYTLGERASEMGREWVAPIAQRRGIPYLDLTDALRAEVARTGQSHVFPDDNHYNAMAHEAAGRALAAWAETLLDGREAGGR
jgi:hypothetical protein